jgi:TAG lipase/steryl ester hydrolase/phospholipase A2/LPA acyltransferase
MHDVSDSESESADLNTWTRSGGPLMRTTSADLFVDFVQNLEVGTELNRGTGTNFSPRDFQYHSPRFPTPDRCFENSESDQRENGNRVVMNGSSITVTEGDLLQPERILNGVVFNVVKKEDLTPSSRSDDNDSYNNDVAECVQIECPGKEMDDTASTASENGDDESSTARTLTEL